MDRTCRKLRRFEPDLLEGWLKLPEPHRGLIRQNEEPESLLYALRQRLLWDASVRMLAFTLPEREAIWWSCMCVRHTVSTFEKLEQRAVEAAEAWVRQPEPSFKYEAALAARDCPTELPGSWSAYGVGWSHREKFAPSACGGRGAVSAVLRTAKRDGADRVEPRLKRFVLSGIDVGNGGAGRLSPEEKGH